MTAMLPLGPTSDAWDHAPVVSSIAASSDWPDEVRTYLETVSLAAHDLSHPNVIHGCHLCPQGGACPLCGKPAPECPDPAGHDRVWREGETSLLLSVGGGQ